MRFPPLAPSYRLGVRLYTHGRCRYWYGAWPRQQADMRCVPRTGRVCRIRIRCGWARQETDTGLASTVRWRFLLHNLHHFAPRLVVNHLLPGDATRRDPHLFDQLQTLLDHDLFLDHRHDQHVTFVPRLRNLLDHLVHRHALDIDLIVGNIDREVMRNRLDPLPDNQPPRLDLAGTRRQLFLRQRDRGSILVGHFRPGFLCPVFTSHINLLHDAEMLRRCEQCKRHARWGHLAGGGNGNHICWADRDVVRFATDDGHVVRTSAGPFSATMPSWKETRHEPVSYTHLR